MEEVKCECFDEVWEIKCECFGEVWEIKDLQIEDNSFSDDFGTVSDQKSYVLIPVRLWLNLQAQKK